MSFFRRIFRALFKPKSTDAEDQETAGEEGATNVVAPGVTAKPYATKQVDKETLAWLAEQEAKLKRGDMAGFFRPAGFQIITVEEDGAEQLDVLPAGIHGHDEKVTAMWIAPNGTIFLCGYMFTGKDGPDTGVVYRKDPGEEARIVFTKAANEIYSIWGCNDTDVYAAGKRTLIHWNGSEWSELDISGIDGNILGGWSNGQDLWIVTGTSAGSGAIYRRAGNSWQKEITTPGVLRSIHGVGDAIWAAGGDGVILRRVGEVWKEERGGLSGTAEGLLVISEHDQFAIGFEARGASLLHSTGNGEWWPVFLPSSRVFGVAGSGPHDVHALSIDGIFKRVGSEWSKLDFDSNACTVIAVRWGTLVCAREKRVSLG